MILTLGNRHISNKIHSLNKFPINILFNFNNNNNDKSKYLDQIGCPPYSKHLHTLTHFIQIAILYGWYYY